MARDNSKDVTHQQTMSKLSEKSKQTSASLLNSTKATPKALADSGDMDGVLGQIYQLMVDNRKDELEQRQIDEKNSKTDTRKEESRHQELLKALTVRRRPKPKRVIRREKKAEEKEAAKPTTPAKKPAEAAKKPAEAAKKPPEPAKKPPEPAKKPAEDTAKKAAEDKAKKAAEDRAKKEAEDKAKKAAEDRAKKEAEDKAKKAVEDKAKKEAEDRAKKAAEDKAKKEAEDKAKKEAEDKAKKSAEQVKPPEVKPPPKAEQVKPPEVKPPPKAEAAPAAPKPPTTPKPSTADKIAIGVATTAALIGRESLAANISKYESGNKGYNAYNRGDFWLAKGKTEAAYLQTNDIDFSKMTITEYLKRTNKKLGAGGQLDAADPNVLFAVGKYQLIPGTMKVMAEKLKLDPNKTYLTPEIQDMLFVKGLTTKGSGGRFAVDDYINGKEGSTRDAAILALAMEFASVGVPYDIKAKSLFKNTLPHVDLKKGETFYKKPGGFNAAHNPPEEVGAALDADRASKLKNKTTTVPPTTTDTGTKVDQSSKENADLKEKLNKDKSAQTTNNTTTTNKQTNNVQSQQKVDDRPPHVRKQQQ